MTKRENKNYKEVSTSKDLLSSSKKKYYRKSRALVVPNLKYGVRSNERYKIFADIDRSKSWMPFRVSDKLDLTELKANFKRHEIMNILVLLAEIRHLSNYHKFAKKRKGLVQIPAQVICDKFTTLGRTYKRTLEKLIDMGYLLFDGSYQVGARSCGYAIGPKLDGSTWTNREFSEYLQEVFPEFDIDAPRSFKYLQLWNRFNHYCREHSKMPDGWLKNVCEKLMEFSADLEVVTGENLDKAINNQATTTFAKYVAKIVKSKGKKRMLWSQARIEDGYRDTVDAINFGFSWIKAHHTGYERGTNRIYSTITNTPRSIRQFFRYKGESLQSVDIRACQVSLLSVFYQPGDEEEKAKFIDTLTKKDIYSFLSRNTSLVRDDAKTAMFLTMFAHSNVSCHGEVYNEFRSNFPILAQRIADKKRKEGYKSVSLEMQRKEAEIMIFGALQELIMDSGVVAWSIHDSILCRAADVEKARETIIRHFTAVMGYAPVLKID